MGRICKICGAKLGEEDNVCLSCGSSIEESEVLTQKGGSGIGKVIFGIIIVVWVWNTFLNNSDNNETDSQIAILETEKSTQTPVDIVEKQDESESSVIQTMETQKEEDIQQFINEEVIEECEILLSIDYLDKIFIDGDSNTEIKIYLNEVELGVANIGEKYAYRIYCEPGQYELSVDRNLLDRDVYEFEVSEDVRYFGVEYYYDWMASSGELRETYYDGNECDDFEYNIDMFAEQINPNKLDENMAIELSDYIKQASDVEELHQVIHNTYNLSFAKKQLADSYDSYVSPAGRLFLGINDYEMTWVIAYRAYSPLYVIDGIWCGMDYEKAYRTLEDAYGADFSLYDFSFEYESIGMVDELAHMQCFNANGDCIGIYQLGDRVGEIMYVKDFFEKIVTE